MENHLQKHALLIKIMKLTISQLFIVCLVAGVSFARVSNAQEVLDKHLTLHIEHQSLKDILREIESNTGVRFAYNKEAIESLELISINARDEKLGVVLDKLLSPLEIQYHVIGKQIVLSKPASVKSKEEALLEYENIEEIISGSVTSADGESVPGVNVILKGTTIGTVTDAGGAYTLALPDLTGTLVFSFIGLVSQEVPISGRTVIDVVMESDVQTLNEVVVVGYGTQKKVNLTGAVSTVSSEVFENRPVSSISQALQGVLPNLNITTNTRGGELGNDRDWNIRGTTSLSGGQPYILVDNVPMDIMDVNPNDIESVTILKDAASSAIYGSRAAYGVILITTKKGEKNKKIKLNYSNNYSWSSPTLLPEMASSIDFARAWNYAYENSGKPPAFTDEQIGLIEQYIADPVNTPPLQRYPANHAKWNRWGAYTLSNGNVDWFPVWFKKNALNKRHDLSIRGGSEKTTYYVSGGFLDQEGLLNFGEDTYRSYNVNANFESDITDWFKFKFNTKLTQRDRKYPNTKQEATNSKGAIYDNISRMWPTMPVYDENGHYYDRNQILPLLEGGSTDTWNNNWITLGGEINPLKGWTVFFDYNWNNRNYKLVNHQPTIYGYNVDETTFILAGNPNSIAETFSNTIYNNTNIYSSYEKSIGANYFKIMAGYQAEQQKYSALSGSRNNLITDAVPSISTATSTTPSLDDEISHWATQGFFGRLNYNYKEKYLAEINARYDGSSRFEDGKRWGFFPSVSLGYRLSEETFWDGIKDVVNDFKIRGSFGELGNQNVPNYLYISAIPVRTNLPYYIGTGRPLYTSAPGLVSADLTWETSSTLDFGVDAELLDNKLSMNFDWYKRTTSNMFGPSEALPSVIGASIPNKNNASLETKGFELSLNWRDNLRNSDFNYDFTVILSDYSSTVTEYNNPTHIRTTYYEGQNIGEIWGYTTGGLFSTVEEANAATASVSQSYLYSSWGAGDMRYVDLNGDGKIDIGKNTVDEPGDMSIIGNSTPRYAFGVKAGFDWKGFNFSMFWQGIAKRDLALTANMFYGFNGDEWGSSVLVQHLDYWTPENTDAYYPKPYMSGEHHKNTKTQTGYLQNGAYTRLKNVQLGYTIPQSITSKLHLERVNFYVSGENLITLTKLPEMFDPEGINGDNGNGEIYPLSKTISVGTSITF